ncbi:MAG: hypothetical protein LBJ02_06155 [Bifidobacteriaceae bacterium]|jgi:hypothetical protein|nr:hypothetical protein [Bifidobacteriaceae bacterium]
MTEHFDLPPVVYVPCLWDARAEERRIALQRTEIGQVALMAYTALDRLQDGAGPGTEWILVKREGIPAIRNLSPFDVILVDQLIPPEARGLEQP